MKGLKLGQKINDITIPLDKQIGISNSTAKVSIIMDVFAVVFSTTAER